MEKAKFKIGDVVVLKSGSPKMTVSDLSESLTAVFKNTPIESEDINVHVAWVDEKGQGQKGIYSEPMLDFYQK